MTKTELEKRFDDFLAKYNNTFIKVLPNSFSPQCYDQAVKWTDLLGVPHAPGNPSPFPYPNAYQIYTDYGAFQAKYFDRIPNTPDYVPQKGDIVLWAGSLNGGIGHVATATGVGDTNKFQTFSQNYPLNSNAHLIETNYNHVLGALRLKVTQSNMNDQKKAVQFDRTLTFLKSVGYISSDDSNLYLDSDKFVALVKGLWADRIVDRPKAGNWDRIVMRAGEPSNSTVDQVVAKLQTGSFDKVKFLEAVKKLLFG